jgi:HlyD family secretion protein
VITDKKRTINKPAKPPLWPVLFLFFVVLLLPGCPWSNNSDQGTLLLSGTIEAREIDLAFQVGGRINQLFKDEGDWVEQDAAIADLDKQDYQLALQQATAMANAAKASLDALKAGTRIQELHVAEADVQKATSQLNYAQSEVKRVSFLIPRKLASIEQLEQKQLQYEVAQAGLEQAKQNFQLLKEGPRQEDIQRADHEYKAQMEAVAQAQRQLAYTTLTSPVPGVATVRLSEAGEVVTAGHPVLRIAALTKPWVRAYLSETKLGRVRLGQSVKVKVDSFPDKVFAGRLSYISPVAEFTPKTVETHELRVDLVYRVKVEVENPEGLLKIGMPADVIIEPITSHE